MPDKLDELGGLEWAKDLSRISREDGHGHDAEVIEALIARVESLQSDLSGKEVLIRDYKDIITKLQAEIEHNGKREFETVSRLQGELRPLRELRDMIIDDEVQESISCPGCLEVLKVKARESQPERERG